MIPTLATISGPLGPFLVPSRPDAKSAELARGVFRGEYAHPRLPRDGIRTILDIGANVGAFSTWAKWMWPEAEIQAYEPNPEAAECCEANMLCGAVHRVAVTVNPDPTLFIAPDLGCASTTFADMGRDKQIKVASVHPKDLTPCDLLKVDAEGAELEILQNYPHLKTCAVVLYEFHCGPPLGKTEDRALLAALCKEAGLTCLRNDASWQGIGIHAREAER